MTAPRRFRGVVVGCSAGGLEALRHLLAPLPATFPLPIVVVAHTAADGGGMLAPLLDAITPLPVVEAGDKMAAEPRRVHIAPAGYHLLLEADETFSLSVDDKVRNVRPAIDVLFDSAADVWTDGTIGIILTGANNDGTAGLKAIKALGGVGIAEDPDQAFADIMPRAAIAAGLIDHVVPLGAIAATLTALVGDRRRSR